MWDARSVVTTYPGNGINWIYFYDHNRPADEILQLGAPPTVQRAFTDADKTYLVMESLSDRWTLWNIRNKTFVLDFEDVEGVEPPIIAFFGLSDESALVITETKVAWLNYLSQTADTLFHGANVVHAILLAERTAIICAHADGMITWIHLSANPRVCILKPLNASPIVDDTKMSSHVSALPGGRRIVIETEHTVAIYEIPPFNESPSDVLTIVSSSFRSILAGQ
jgi:hypothetical protein